MKSGILLIDKNKDITSRDIVNKVCKIFNTKKVGHTGTLDPIATGVLVLGINNGTKIIELLTSDDKEYIAKVKIGIQTDTYDITGNVISNYYRYLDDNEIISVLNRFVGSYMQEVPKYSAVKINGKKLYEYAREKIDIELPKREVFIKSISFIKRESDDSFTFKVSVSKGTYIRSLINDIGKSLNVSMTMEELRRTRQGIFNIESCKDISNINECDIISINDALSNIKEVIVDSDTEKKVINGAKIKISSGMYRILNKENKLLAIYNNDRPYRVFGGNDEEN